PDPPTEGRSGGQHSGRARDRRGLDRAVLPEARRKRRDDERGRRAAEGRSQPSAHRGPALRGNEETEEPRGAHECEEQWRSDGGGIAGVEEPPIRENETEGTARRERGGCGASPAAKPGDEGGDADERASAEDHGAAGAAAQSRRREDDQARSDRDA